MSDDKKIGINIEKQTAIHGDITPVAEGVKSVAESIPSGVDKLFMALFGKRYVNNKRHEALTVAQLEKELKAIACGDANFDSKTGQLIPKEQSNYLPTNIEDAVIHEKNCNEAVNILKCSKTAFDTLLDKPAQEDEQEFPYEFFSHWRETAKLVTDEQLQTMWGNILAEEIAEPQSISLKTLETLRVLSKYDIQNFQQLCKYVVNDEIVIHFSNEATHVQKDFYSRLVDLGLCSNVVSTFATQITTESIDQNRYKLVYGNYVIVFPRKIDFYYHYELTFVGKELYRIIKQNLSEDDLQSFCTLLFSLDGMKSFSRLSLYFNSVGDEKDLKYIDDFVYESHLKAQ